MQFCRYLYIMHFFSSFIRQFCMSSYPPLFMYGVIVFLGLFSSLCRSLRLQLCVCFFMLLSRDVFISVFRMHVWCSLFPDCVLMYVVIFSCVASSLVLQFFSLLFSCFFLSLVSSLVLFFLDLVLYVVRVSLQLGAVRVCLFMYVVGYVFLSLLSCVFSVLVIPLFPLFICLCRGSLFLYVVRQLCMSFFISLRMQVFRQLFRYVCVSSFIDLCSVALFLQLGIGLFVYFVRSVFLS